MVIAHDKRHFQTQFLENVCKFISIAAMFIPWATIGNMSERFLPTLYWAYDYLSILGLKLIHVCKRGTSWLEVAKANDD